MKLCDSGLQNKGFWEERGYALPQFDRAAVREGTKSNPVWVHFGAGNIFRAYIAALQQRLLDEGLQNKGIIAAEGYDYEIIDVAYKPFDNLSISVTLVPDGKIKKAVIASVVETVKADDSAISRMREIFASESLQMATFTITEKGYDICRSNGSPLDAVAQDFSAGPGSPQSFLGKLASLCLHRHRNGAAPLALVSMDNCSKNGDLLSGAVHSFAAQWVRRGYAKPSFLNYVSDPDALSFPCTMIDKITPYPDPSVAKMLTDDGLDHMAITVTAKKTETAPFVNSEAPEYLVVEELFPNGRPPLEKAGVIFADRETVDKAEKMKVCACLNPLHTALAVFACMLSYTRVSDAMKDPQLLALLQGVANESLPVAADPKVISPAEFLDTVINVRLPNPYIPDTPQRIATDTSRKLAVRFGETIKEYVRNQSLDVRTLHAIPMTLAGWCRYLLGIGDDGSAFELDPDPMHPVLLPLLSGIRLGSKIDCAKTLRPLLSNSGIFGVDLYDSGIAEKVTEYFEMMIKGKGAVRKALCTLKTNA